MVALAIVIPAMIVFNSPTGSLPVACKELRSIMMGSDPVRALVWWPRPVTGVPPIVAAYGIPIAVYP